MENSKYWTLYIWCEIQLKQIDSLIVGVCYTSPNCPENYNDKQNSQIKKVCDYKPSHMCVMGDFKFKEVKRDLHTVEGSSNSQARKFYENMQDLFLYQHVTENTRFRHGHSPSQLDLVFKNKEHMIESVNVQSPLRKSDHFVVYSGNSFVTGQGK